MRQFIVLFITLVLAFIGYGINSMISNYNYLFCTVWGCIMTLVNIHLNDS